MTKRQKVVESLLLALVVGVLFMFMFYTKPNKELNEQQQFSQDILLADYYFVGIVVEKETQISIVAGKDYYKYKIYDVENDKVHIVSELYSDDYGNRIKQRYGLSIGDKVIVIQTKYGLSVYDYEE